MTLYGGVLFANTFWRCRTKPHCRAILSGGSFTPATPFKPLDFHETLNNICPDIVYSAAGVHTNRGATCFNLERLPVKHWAAGNGTGAITAGGGSQ